MRRKKTKRDATPPNDRNDAELAGEARLVGIERHGGTNPTLAGGDVDADWQGAESAGEEAVGGTVATPDQDVVDEIGRALGVTHDPAEEVRTSEEILRERDRRRWQLEWEAAKRRKPR